MRSLLDDPKTGSQTSPPRTPIWWSVRYAAMKSPASARAISGTRRDQEVGSCVQPGGAVPPRRDARATVAIAVHLSRPGAAHAHGVRTSTTRAVASGGRGEQRRHGGRRPHLVVAAALARGSARPQEAPAQLAGALALALEFLLAGGLLRLAVSATWAALATAALIVV